MNSSSPCVVAPNLPQVNVFYPADCMRQSSLSAAADRIDGLRSELLKRDGHLFSLGFSCSTPPVLLGQWRN